MDVKIHKAVNIDSQVFHVFAWVYDAPIKVYGCVRWNVGQQLTISYENTLSFRGVEH